MTDDAYESLADHVDELSDRPDSAEFREALGRLEALAESGNVDAAELVAEIRSLQGPNHDAASAYRWYYVALSVQGYSTEFDDRNNLPPSYCGPAGDFRNEAPVSELVTELGFDRARQIDAETRTWLEARGLGRSP